MNRTEILIGKENLNKLKNSNVAIFGVGGVGGYVTEMLVRAGIENITIIDFDNVDKSNLNRQIIALNSTIGQPKVEVMKNRILDINPNCNINAINCRYTKENSETLLNLNYDYVIDAIDSVNDKINLIVECKKKELPIISAMGAGNRIGIPNFKITDISKTYNDGLAKVVRKKLKNENISKLDVAFCEDLPLTKGEITGSISYFPSMCGCVISAYVIEKLINK